METFDFIGFGENLQIRLVCRTRCRTLNHEVNALPGRAQVEFR